LAVSGVDKLRRFAPFIRAEALVCLSQRDILPENGGDLTMKALVVEHTISEGMGLLKNVLGDNGWHLDIRCMEQAGTTLPENINEHDCMVIMGGPMGANDEDRYPHLLHVQDLIRQAAHCHVPTVGICLGAQLISKALGGRVTRNPVKEIGWYKMSLTEYGYRSPLFDDLPADFIFFQWHQDTFTIPEHSRWLVRGKTCRNQAFSIDNYIWGLQFHPEVTLEMINRWVEEGKDELEKYGGRSEARLLLERSTRIWEETRDFREAILNNIEKVLHA